MPHTCVSCTKTAFPVLSEETIDRLVGYDPDPSPRFREKSLPFMRAQFTGKCSWCAYDSARTTWAVHNSIDLDYVFMTPAGKRRVTTMRRAATRAMHSFLAKALPDAHAAHEAKREEEARQDEQDYLERVDVRRQAIKRNKRKAQAIQAIETAHADTNVTVRVVVLGHTLRTPQLLRQLQSLVPAAPNRMVVFVDKTNPMANALRADVASLATGDTKVVVTTFSKTYIKLVGKTFNACVNSRLRHASATHVIVMRDKRRKAMIQVSEKYMGRSRRSKACVIVM